jgi:hypothetical protein
MAYTKNTWADGDVVTSEKLNHMEDGIANSENVFIVGGVSLGENDALEGTLDKTWQEIHDAMQNKICIVVIPTDGGFLQVSVSGAIMIDGAYIVIIDGIQFSTSTVSGYPIATK